MAHDALDHSDFEGGMKEGQCLLTILGGGRDSMLLRCKLCLLPPRKVKNRIAQGPD